MRNVYTTVYNVRDTIFTNQTGKFPDCSLSGNNYLMMLVEIDSSAILVETINNHSDAKLTRAYSMLMLRLHKAGVTPYKHVLDNKISTSMKALIIEKYKMVYDLYHKATISGMWLRLPYKASKHIFSAFWPG
jgi:hypothetical protein